MTARAVPGLRAIAGAPRRLLAWVRDAGLWQNSGGTLALILSVEALTVGWLLAASASQSLTWSDGLRFAILLAMAAVYAECGGRIERLRSFVCSDGAVFSTATSLWCFAASLTLPVGLAGCFAVAVYGHAMVHLVRNDSVTPFRFVYTTATGVLGTLASATIVQYFNAVPLGTASVAVTASAVVVAMVAFAVTNEFLVGLAVYITARPASLRSMLASADDEAMEFAELMLGVLLAVTIIYAPYLGPASLIPLVVLRRSALVRTLQAQATLDAKTGLLNAAAWRRRAEKEIELGERLGTPMSLLMIDLDHFKQLNDEHGHPAGDAALRAIGECLIEALRGKDSVGRFGGEEFVALLPGADAAVSARIAERLRQRIAALELDHGGRITASIGVSTGVSGGNRLDELISVADKALYVSKAAGRNHVHVQAVGAPVGAIDRSLGTDGAGVNDAQIEAAVERLLRDLSN